MLEAQHVANIDLMMEHNYDYPNRVLNVFCTHLFNVGREGKVNEVIFQKIVREYLCDLTSPVCKNITNMSMKVTDIVLLLKTISYVLEHTTNNMTDKEKAVLESIEVLA